MNILDENIPENQRQLLRGWRIRVRHIGQDVGRQGMSDEEIIPLLHQLSSTTFFTRDRGFYDRSLCHNNYCLVYLAVEQFEVASFVRRFLRHPAFRARATRMAKSVRVSRMELHVWERYAETERKHTWNEQD